MENIAYGVNISSESFVWMRYTIKYEIFCIDNNSVSLGQWIRRENTIQDRNNRQDKQTQKHFSS